jgi:transposase-like protein
MHDLQTQKRFVELRTQGWSFARIARELGVAKQTLIEWSRKFRFDVQNMRAMELESLQEQLISTREARARILAQQLAKIEGELAKRDLVGVSTGRLFTLAESLRRQIMQETGPLQFTSPIKDIPDDEYRDQVQDWKP